VTVGEDVVTADEVELTAGEEVLTMDEVVLAAGDNDFDRGQSRAHRWRPMF
jgi:hypothetical protein